MIFFVIESITGGASTSSGTDYPTGFGYPCAGTASFGEHLPIKAVITCPNNECKWWIGQRRKEKNDYLFVFVLKKEEKRVDQLSPYIE